jgi:CPA1 family monovalent cation:H+ antiporter
VPVDSAVLILLVVAAAVAIAAHRLRVPYTVALVVAGVVLGQMHALEPPHLTKELLFAVFLPGLIFESAFHLQTSALLRNRLTIFSLAIPGVLAALALTAVVMVPTARLLHLEEAFTWQHALVFGALIAATDPIAVVALFRNLGAPSRLVTLIEGESLLNDGTSIVFFGLVLGVVSGVAVTAGGVALELIQVVGIGVLVGSVIGFTLSKVTQQVNDPMIEITLTTIAAYGSFIIAERFHGSGVIATVAAGMLVGNYGAKTGMSPATRVAVDSFWEYIAFALNSIVFLLIGFEVKLGALAESWQLILAAFVVVLGGRAAVVYLVTGLLSRTDERVPASWRAVLTWGGLRGGLSMVLALSLPESFPHRDLLVVTTFGVVLLSILVQGLTMAPLLRRLGMVHEGDAQGAYQLARGELRIARAARKEIESFTGPAAMDPAVIDPIREEYDARITAAEGRLRELHLQRSELTAEEIVRARRQLLILEKEEALNALHQGVVGREAYDQLAADIDTRLLRLDEDPE